MHQSHIITITRQIGSGGSYIGKKLADRFGLHYADRVILRDAATQLQVMEEDLKEIEERRQSFWYSLLDGCAAVGKTYVAPELIIAPRNRDLFEAEAKIIEELGQKGNVVIVGRCGFHLLRKFSNHTAIFLHGEPNHRISRIEEVYGTSREEAEKMIIKVDNERNTFCKTFTGRNRTDARNFDLSLDTSLIGLDTALELITTYIKEKEATSCCSSI